MKLDDFVEEARRDADFFLAYWLRMNAESPEHYPLEMSAGDWDEQFIAFRDLRYCK